ncbi:hypothetical protein ACFGVS_14655 [Mucilaginibacter sp. AW1-7]|uniref:hypothetical protein n=1 Tax=Mucilaginibacter sp. AW1-7 TaxID=3349874 RepID=UPI003F73C760
MGNKILIKTVIYLLVIFGICQVLNIVFPSKAIVVQRKWVTDIMAEKDTLQSLTFGRSHGFALHYDHWDYKGQNLSLGGEDIASINYSLNYFLPKLTNLKEVLICISYSSLYFDNEALSNGNLNDARKAIYASIPSYKLVSPKDYNNMFFGKMFAFMHADYGFEEFKNLVQGNKEFTKGDEKKTALDSLHILESASVQAYDHSKDKTIALEYNPHIRDEYVNYLKQIASVLKSKNIACVFFTPPYYKEYTRLYPQADIKETEKFMQQICKETGAEYYNFSTYKPIANDIKWFYNADHLNEQGGESFTKLFNKILRNKATIKMSEYPDLRVAR